MDFFEWGFLGSFLILILTLGQNTGNSHTYFLELPLPFLLLATLPFIDRNIRPVFLRIPSIALCLISIIPLGATYQTDFAQYSNAYQQMETRMDQCRQIYGAPIAAPYLIGRNASVIYDNGLSEYAYTIINSKNPILQKVLGGNDGQLENRWNLWNQALGEKVKSHAFDCIVIDSRIQEIGNVMLSEYYTPESQILDVLDWDVVTYSVRVDITIWVPKE